MTVTQLKREHREEITEILKAVIGLEHDTRKAFLVHALVGTNALEHVEFGGSLFTFTQKLIETMLNYGEVEKGKHALWALLETARAQMGVDYEARIDALRPHIETLLSYPVAVPEEKRFFPWEVVPSVPPVTDEEREVSPLQAARDYVNGMRPIPPETPRFWMSPYLVSNRLYYAFVSDNCGWLSAANVGDRSYLKHWIEGKPRKDQWQLPVTNITFRAATAFADWLSKLTSNKVRLPKLQEWEMAASAGRSNWFKEEIEAGRVNYFKTAGHLHSVYAFSPNPYGIRDLIGQVFDLCFSDDLLKPVIVGGAHYETEAQLRKSLQAQEVRSDKCPPYTGFRCVRSA